MQEKFVDIVQSSFAFVIFLSIVGVSTLSVVALNPREGVTANQEPSNGTVRGVDNTSSQKDILINNVSTNNNYYTATQNFDVISKEYFYKIKYNPSKTKEEFKFIEVFNNSKEESSLEFETTINGYVLGDLTIRVKDGENIYAVYDPTLRRSNFRIKLPANSQKIYTIEYELKEKVNFPIEITFKLK